MPLQSHICTDYGDRVVFKNNSDYATFKRGLVKVSPVFFRRGDDVEMAPEGHDEQLNTAFTKMVAWRNVSNDDGLEYRTGRPDLERERIKQEARYQDMVNPRSYYNEPVEEERPRWTPPSPR